METYVIQEVKTSDYWSEKEGKFGNLLYASYYEELMDAIKVIKTLNTFAKVVNINVST